MLRWLCFAAAFVTGCSGNVLQRFADTKSDAVLYQKALTAVDKADYSGALDTISSMSDSYQQSRQVINLRASAYGGICGINFLSFVQDFTNIGGTRLFPFLIKEFTAATSTRLDACLQAQALLTSIGDVSARTNDENLFLALVGLAKVGNLLDYYTDPNASGAADPSVDVCQDTRASRPTQAVAGNFYDADLRELGVGLTLALSSLQAVASQTSLGQGQITSLSQLCAQLPSNFCTTTDPTQFTTLQVYGVQTLIKEGSVVGLGLGACDGQDISVCYCP